MHRVQFERRVANEFRTFLEARYAKQQQRKTAHRQRLLSDQQPPLQFSASGTS